MKQLRRSCLKESLAERLRKLAQRLFRTRLASPMRILIVEDCLERTRLLLRQCSGHDVTVVPTAQEAMNILGKTRFDFLFLDYSLGDSKGNGLDVVRHLRTLGLAATPAIVHSEDTTAAQQMASLLPRSRALPFFSLKELAEKHGSTEWMAKCLSICGVPHCGNDSKAPEKA